MKKPPWFKQPPVAVRSNPPKDLPVDPPTLSDEVKLQASRRFYTDNELKLASIRDKITHIRAPAEPAGVPIMALSLEQITKIIGENKYDGRGVDMTPELIEFARAIEAAVQEPVSNEPAKPIGAWAKVEFRAELEALLKKHSMSAESCTPDFILVSFILSSLTAFDMAIQHRAAWYGHPESQGRKTPPDQPPTPPSKTHRLRGV